MICDEAQLELSAYLDNEVPAQERTALETHIKECPACQALLAELGSVKSSLSDLPKLKAPATLAGSVRRSISDPVSATPSSNVIQFQTTPRRSMWAPAMMGVAALLVAAVMIFVLLPLVSNQRGNEVGLAQPQNEPRSPAPVKTAPATGGLLPAEKQKSPASAGAEPNSKLTFGKDAENRKEEKSAPRPAAHEDADAGDEVNALRQQAAPETPAQDKADGSPDSARKANRAAAAPVEKAKDGLGDERRRELQDRAKKDDAAQPATKSSKPQNVPAQPAEAGQEKAQDAAPFKRGADGKFDDKNAGEPAPTAAPSAPSAANKGNALKKNMEEAARGGPEKAANLDAPIAKVPTDEQVDRVAKSGSNSNVVNGTNGTNGAKDSKDKSVSAPRAPAASPPGVAQPAPAVATASAAKSAAPDAKKYDQASANDRATEKKAKAEADKPAEPGKPAQSFAGNKDLENETDALRLAGKYNRDAAAEDSKKLNEQTLSADKDDAQVQPSGGRAAGQARADTAKQTRRLGTSEPDDSTPLANSVQRLGNGVVVCRTQNPARLIRELKKLSDASGGRFGMGDLAALSKEELSKAPATPSDASQKEAEAKVQPRPLDENAKLERERNSAPAASLAAPVVPEPVVYKISVSAAKSSALLDGIQKFAASDKPTSEALKSATKQADAKEGQAAGEIGELQGIRNPDAKDSPVVERKGGVQGAGQSGESKPAADEAVIYIEIVTIP